MTGLFYGVGCFKPGIPDFRRKMLARRLQMRLSDMGLTASGRMHAHALLGRFIDGRTPADEVVAALDELPALDRRHLLASLYDRKPVAKEGTHA